MRLVAALLLFVCLSAHAEPLFQTEGNGIRIVLYSDDCKLKDQITNLPRRAVWTEGGKDTEGCWAPNQQLGVVVMWFADKTTGVGVRCNRSGESKERNAAT